MSSTLGIYDWLPSLRWGTVDDDGLDRSQCCPPWIRKGRPSLTRPSPRASFSSWFPPYAAISSPPQIEAAAALASSRGSSAPALIVGRRLHHRTRKLNPSLLLLSPFFISYCAKLLIRTDGRRN